MLIFIWGSSRKRDSFKTCSIPLPHGNKFQAALKYKDKILTYWLFFLKTCYCKTDTQEKPPDSNFLKMISDWWKKKINSLLNDIISVFYIQSSSYKFNQALQFHLIHVSSTILIHNENYNCFAVMEKHLAMHLLFVVLQRLKQAERLQPAALRFGRLASRMQVFLLDSQRPQNLFPSCCPGRFGTAGSL